MHHPDNSPSRMNANRCPAAAAMLIGLCMLAGCGKEITLAGGATPDDPSQLSLREQLEQLQGIAGMAEAPVIRLAPGTIAEELSITGELAPIDSALVYPQMDGRIRFLREIRVGDQVEKGEVIAKIDDRDIEDEIERQRKQIDITAQQIALDESDLEQKGKNLEFDREMLAKGFINQFDFESSENQLKQAEIALRRSRIQLEQERNILAEYQRKREKVPVVAPIGGMVVLASHLTGAEEARIVNEEIMSLEDTLVGPSTQLFGVVSNEGYLAQCRVNGKDKARLESGQRARVTVISSQPIEVGGVVDRVSLLQDPVTHAYKVWLRLDEIDRSFTSGLFVRANVELSRRTNTLVVNKEYVKSINNEDVVQVVVDEQVRNVTVTTGLADEERVELTSGVEAGEMIIASPEMFAPDQRVKPREVAREIVYTSYAAPAGQLPMEFSPATPHHQTLTIAVEDEVSTFTIARVRLSVYDADVENEISVGVNGGEWIPLGAEGDGQLVTATLDLAPGTLVSGDNQVALFFFSFNGTTSCRVEDLRIMVGQ